MSAAATPTIKCEWLEEVADSSHYTIGAHSSFTKAFLKIEMNISPQCFYYNIGCCHEKGQFFLLKLWCRGHSKIVTALQ